MDQTPRRRLSVAQREEIWRRWRAGDPLLRIGKGFGRRHSTFLFILAKHGGITPAPRRRASLALTLAERESISRGIGAGWSIRAIAGQLGRAPSSVSREVARHGGRRRYRATDADRDAWAAACRPKRCLLALNPRLQRIVSSRLSLDWSPEQISGRLKTEFPADESMRVSHETIYRSLFIQARGVLKKELVRHLRSKRPLRHSRLASRHCQTRGRLIDTVSIRERPAEAQDCAVPGHWEGDLLSGTKNTHIAMLVERHSRFTTILKLPNRETGTVVAALARQIRRLPASLRRSLTWDQGKEMAMHKRFTVATDVNVYFCDPHSPWQRGTNENTSRLLRQYLPKGTDLSRFSQSDLERIARRLNQRSRETLDFQTPAARLQASVAATR